MVRHRLELGVLVCCGLGSGVGGLEAQATHTVRLTGDRAAARYSFEPDRVTVRPGDVVRFVVVSGPPHSITFDSAGVSPADQALLNAAIVRRLSFLSGPLLTREEEVYELVVPRLGAGSYRFYCLPHRAYRAGGTLVVAQ